MSRRRRTSNPFTLFSFQDIVTSVTAVLILVTLFIALELIHRELNAAPVVATRSVDKLRQAVEDMRARLAQRRATLQQSHDDLRQMASRSPDTLRREASALAEQAESLANENAALAGRAESLGKRVAALAAREAQRAEARRGLASVTAATADAQRELKNRGRGSEVVYNPTPESGKRAWLVVVNRAGVSASPWNAPRDAVEFRSKLLEPATAAFKQWLSKRNSAVDCFLVLARPEGIDAAQSLIKTLRGEGFDTGFDLIGATEHIMLPEPATAPGTGSEGSQGGAT